MCARTVVLKQKIIIKASNINKKINQPVAENLSTYIKFCVDCLLIFLILKLNLFDKKQKLKIAFDICFG